LAAPEPLTSIESMAGGLHRGGSIRAHACRRPSARVGERAPGRRQKA
jgi:hypothetical protein